MLGAGAGCTQLTAPLLLLLSPQWLSLSCSRSPSISPLSQQNLVIPSPGPAVRAVVAGGSLLCVVVVISCDVRAAHVAARDSTSGCIRARGDTITPRHGRWGPLATGRGGDTGHRSSYTLYIPTLHFPSIHTSPWCPQGRY